MAQNDLQSFLEDRLLALDPGLDLSTGSPAQVRVISPIIDYLGTDPFETDVDSFIIDRLAQEFPQLYAGDPGALRDIFINPLRLLLEPFKREIQSIRRAQSLIDPSQLSDDDADALVANVFDVRDSGGHAVGTARLYYANPTDVRIEVSNRAYSKNGLNFFPTGPAGISAESMAFNRDGSLFYMDLPVRAENTGVDYNIAAGDLAGVDGVANVVRVTNLRKFTGGSERQDTVSFVAAAEQSLTERSLVTRRGAAARLSSAFRGDVRSIQVVGAKDAEMQRDLLVATSPGHAWITGKVELYNRVAYVRARTLDGSLNEVPRAGDTLYVYLSQVDFPDVEIRFVRLTVEEMLFGPLTTTGEFQASYFVRWSGDLPSAVSMPRSFEGGFAKKGTVKVSSIPDAGVVDLSVANKEVHLFGRADIYVRPTTQDTSKVVIDGAYDLGKLGSTSRSPHYARERLTLGTVEGTNAVTDIASSDTNFTQAGVEIGDILSLEEGADAGLYLIGDISTDGRTLYLDQPLTATSPASGLRYRVLKNIRINPFEGRIVHFPFGDVVQADLRTTIASNLVTLSRNDLLKFGARAGDLLRILGGPDAGDYTIQGFDTKLGGQGVFVDRKLTATSYDLSFEVFTPLGSVQRPLVRIRELLVLDSAKQTTGLTIPPADPVAVVPTGPFSSAKVLGESELKSGFVLPDLTGYANRTSVAAGSGDRRYSLGFDRPSGAYIPVRLADGSISELDLGSDTMGKTSYFVAIPEEFDEAENFPPIDPQPGEALTIRTGANKGSYTVRSVRKFKYKHERTPGVFVDAWSYFIRIYGTFPIDPLARIIEFLKAHALGADDGLTYSLPLDFPGFFSTWFEGLGQRVRDALARHVASPPPAADLQKIVESMCKSEYSCGLPARGILRTYMREPTLFEQKTGTADQVTTFSFKAPNGEVVKFRPDPARYRKQEVIPARVTEDSNPTDYPRDLDASTATAPRFTDTSRRSIFSSGVRPGDILSVHEERFLLGFKTTQVIVQTDAGSPTIVAPAVAGNVFEPDMVGCLVFLEEGFDAGGYRITQYVNPRTVVLDRVLGTSSPAIVKEGSGTMKKEGVENQVIAGSALFSDSDVGLYLTAFDCAWEKMGSWKIRTLVNRDNITGTTNTVSVELPNGSSFSTSAESLRWVVTEAPELELAPITRGDGSALATETLAGVPIRVYSATPSDFPITSVVHDAVVSGAGIANPTQLTDGIAQPYRIYRPNVRRVTSTEMDENREGFLCYFDTEVISLSPSENSNLSRDSYLTTENFHSLGYRHAVEDPNFSYSVKEEGFLDLPLSILPVGAADSFDNLVRVIGTPIQISYEKADLVMLFQEFLDSAQDRVLAASLLARHFLPAYISYDAQYFGGSDPGVIAKDIRSYVDTVPVETPVDVSEIESIIARRGGNPITPTRVSATIYDWDRKMWVEFSENSLGGPNALDTKVPYNGTPRVTFFLPGFDASEMENPPPGERINLVRG